MPSCPLCHDRTVTPLGAIVGREYAACTTCALRFMLPAHHPSRDDERAVYDLHENAVHDPRYRAFLDRLALPLQALLPPGASGLDYGCGPGPALAAMLEERGFRMATHDPYFAPNADALARQYDFVTCTEVAEHFHDPAAEFVRLAGLLRPGGVLALMTQRLPEDQSFATWHYVRDPTHVCFYAERTLHWLAERHGWHLQQPAPSVALFVQLPR